MSNNKATVNLGTEKFGNNLIVNLSFTYDISKWDASECGNNYELGNVPNPLTIWAIGRTEDDEHFVYSLFVMKNNKNEVLFFGTPDQLVKDDPSDIDDEGSIFKTVQSVFKLKDFFDEEYEFEIIDLIDNLLNWVDPQNAINYLNLEHEYEIGDYSIQSSENIRCFVSRYIAGNDDFDICGEVDFEIINSINENANYDVFSDYDTAIIIK